MNAKMGRGGKGIKDVGAPLVGARDVEQKKRRHPAQVSPFKQECISPFGGFRGLGLSPYGYFATVSNTSAISFRYKNEFVPTDLRTNIDTISSG